jgi:hypothetical protein
MTVLSFPMDLYFTTATASNHATDSWEMPSQGIALNCHTVVSGPGTPFALDGGAILPYVGTGAQVVAAGAVLDKVALGLELDAQYKMELALTPAEYAVSNLTVNPDPAAEGNTVNFSVDVTRVAGGSGPITVNLSVIDVCCRNNVVHADAQATGSLNVGDTETVNFTGWATGSGDAGGYRAVVDYQQDQFFVSQSGSYILLTPSVLPAAPTEGDNVSVSVMIVNQGASADSWTLHLDIFDAETCTIVYSDDEDTGSVLASHAATVNFDPWATGSGDAGSYYVCVEYRAVSFDVGP